MKGRKNGDSPKLIKLTPADLNHHEIYNSPLAKDIIAVNMLVFSYTAFSSAYCISNIDKYEVLKQKLLNGDLSVLNEIGRFGLEAIIDSVKISICFENFFKVKLLYADKLIHKIKPTVGKDISKLQQRSPIGINEVFPTTEIYTLDKLAGRLSANTIEFSSMLRPEYAACCNVNEKIIEYLIDINRLRNTLHLYSMAQGAINVHLMRELIKLVLCDMAVWQNNIVDRLDISSKNRLKPLCF